MVHFGITSESDFVGCTETEIEDLELRHGMLLPNAYIDFLRCMGHSIARIGHFSGDYLEMAYRVIHDATLDERQSIAEFAPDEVERCLPPTAFIICSRMGQQFILIDGSVDVRRTDSPVYYLGEERAEGRRLVCGSFLEWFAEVVTGP